MDSSSESSSDEDANDKPLQDVSAVPFGTLKRIRDQTNRTVLKKNAFRGKRALVAFEHSADQGEPDSKLSKKKGRPEEVSSLRPVMPQSVIAQRRASKHKGLHMPRRDCRDPRFSDFSGKLNIDLFSKSYSFLDEYRANEKEVLLRSLKQGRKPKANDPDDEASQGQADKEVEESREGDLDDDMKLEAKRLLAQIKSEEVHRKKLGVVQATSKRLKADEAQRIMSTGKKPFFVKSGVLKKLAKQELQAEKSEKSKEKRSKRLHQRQKKKDFSKPPFSVRE